MNEEQQKLEIYAFKYDTRAFGLALSRFSSPELAEGIEILLERKQYAPVPGDREQRVSIYASPLTSDRYLAVITIQHYRFVFYLPDDADLVAWSRTYVPMTDGLLLQQLLPSEPRPIAHQRIPMDLKKVFGR